MRRRIAIVLALALAGCGKQETLRPASGQSLPVKAATAAQTPTPAQLLAPTAQQRPQRSDDLLLKSETRRDDRFDLPPH